MTLPSKLYEALKFLAKLVPLIVTFIGATFVVLGVSEATTNIILVVVGAVGSLIEGIIEICKANHYKLKLDDGTVKEIDSAEGEVN